jgi:hypothetical protein
MSTSCSEPHDGFFEDEVQFVVDVCSCCSENAVVEAGGYEVADGFYHAVLDGQCSAAGVRE